MVGKRILLLALALSMGSAQAGWTDAFSFDTSKLSSSLEYGLQKLNENRNSVVAAVATGLIGASLAYYVAKRKPASVVAEPAPVPMLNLQKDIAVLGVESDSELSALRLQLYDSETALKNAKCELDQARQMLEILKNKNDQYKNKLNKLIQKFAKHKSNLKMYLEKYEKVVQDKNLQVFSLDSDSLMNPALFESEMGLDLNEAFALDSDPDTPWDSSPAVQ